MINTAETIAPGAKKAPFINTAETVPPGSSDRTEKSEETVLLAGESIAGSYVVNSLMKDQGRQADVYLSKKWGKSYVIKLYHGGWQPSARLQNFLMNVRHPNIAPVLDCGEYRGRYYEVYNYYHEGTLETAGKLSPSHIQKVIVPSINEGLHELHLNDIIHCDIKPGNLFYKDDKSGIIIGDCGISAYTNSDGKLMDSPRGTPEFSPPVKSVFGYVSLTPAYDYGSFGLVLCKAFLGQSLFKGMSPEEISLAWDRGIDLPPTISGSLAALIRGLLNPKEEERFGYNEVKRWCEGEYISQGRKVLPSRLKRSVRKKPLIFGKINGTLLSVETPHQLEKAIKTDWVQATNVVKKRELVDFIRQFDEKKTEKVKELASCRDSDSAVFRLLMYISDDPSPIFYCGKSYKSLSAYINALASGRDKEAEKFLFSGMLIFYLRYNNFEPALVDRLEQFIKTHDSPDMTSIATICLALMGKKSYTVFGETVDSVRELLPLLYSRSITEIDRLLREDNFIAWMNRQGYEAQMRIMREEY